MKKIDIARKHGYSSSYISQIVKHDKFTPDIMLARDVAALCHKAPLSFMPPKLRGKYRTQYPELGRVIKVRPK